MKRLVHFASHGREGLSFDCYHSALRAYLGGAKGAVPQPLCRSDIRKVTCRECLHGLAVILADKLKEKA